MGPYQYKPDAQGSAYVPGLPHSRAHRACIGKNHSAARLSKVVVGAFPTSNGEAVTPLVIRSEIERFMVHCVGPCEASFEAPADFDKEGLSRIKAVGLDTSGRWWIARMYGRRGGKMMLRVHWVGQESEVCEHVLPVFVSIDPVLCEENSDTN